MTYNGILAYILSNHNSNMLRLLIRCLLHYLQRSVRQGCSLSPLLYVLCIEPFAHRIRMDPMIKGISLPGTTETATICQYADDTNLFISDTRSVKYILTLVNLYEKVSGAILNKDKTFGMWLGRWRGCSKEPGGLKWTSDFQKKLRCVHRYNRRR